MRLSFETYKHNIHKTNQSKGKLKMKHCKQAFTLIELLVVICIIAILASMLLPALQSARESASTATCISNLGQFAKAYQMYATSYNDFMPALTDPQGTSGSCGWEDALMLAIGQDPAKNPPFKKALFCDGDASSETASSGGNKKSYALNNLKQAIHPYIPDTLGKKGVIGLKKNANMGYISGNKTTSVYTASDLIIIGECPTESNTIGNAKFSASDAASNSGTASAIHQQICIKPKRYTTHSSAGELFLDGHAKHMRPQQTLPSKAKDDGKTQIDGNFFIETKTSYSDGTKKLASTAWGSWTDCPNRKVGTDCEGESAGTCRKK